MIIKWNKEHLSSLLAEGKTVKEISILLGVADQTVYNAMARFGIPRPGRKKKEPKPKVPRKKKTAIEKKLALKRNMAKFIGTEWNPEIEKMVWPTHCPVLGLELDYGATKRQENSPSIDRLDSTKGYIPGNVYVISWRANRIKNDGTAEEHRMIADFIESKSR